MTTTQDNKQKMIETCQGILNGCDKPFVWEEEDTYKYHDIKRLFNLFMPHPEIEKELLALFEKMSGQSNLYDQVNALCTLDKQWFETGTYGLDRNINMFFRQYSLQAPYVEQVKAYFQQRLQELES